MPKSVKKEVLIYDDFTGVVTGTLVSHHDRFAVVARRNSHGTHNLVLCIGDVTGHGWQAYRHGNEAVIAQCLELRQKKLAYRCGAWLTRKW